MRRYFAPIRFEGEENSQQYSRRRGSTSQLLDASRNCLEQKLELRAPIAMLVVVLELREERNERVLRAEYEVVVQPPINLAHAARWMPEALQGVLENLARAQGHAERLDRVEDVLRDMR